MFEIVKQILISDKNSVSKYKKLISDVFIEETIQINFFCS